MSTSIINFRKGFSDVIYDEDFLTVLPKRIIGKDVPHAHSFKKWMSSSDANNGGTSFCSFSANNSLVFKGRVVFDEEIAQRMHTRSGFCALRGSLKDTLDLRDYEGLELYMKSNTPVLVTLNMGCESYFDSDIFQFHFHVHDTWRKYHIPFHKFMWVNYLQFCMCNLPVHNIWWQRKYVHVLFHISLTTQGMESLQQKENDSLRCQSFGFLIRSPNGEWFLLTFDLVSSLVVLCHFFPCSN